MSDFFEKTKDSCEPIGWCEFCWIRNKKSFGLLGFHREDDKIICENKGMSKETIKQLLNQMVVVSW